MHARARKRNHKKERQPASYSFFPDGWLSFFLVVSFSWFLMYARAKTHKKEKPRIDTVTGITDTNFLSNATGNGDRKCIWQKDSVCVTGTFLSSAGVFVVRARVKRRIHISKVRNYMFNQWYPITMSLPNCYLHEMEQLGKDIGNGYPLVKHVIPYWCVSSFTCLTWYLLPTDHW